MSTKTTESETQKVIQFNISDIELNELIIIDNYVQKSSNMEDLSFTVNHHINISDDDNNGKCSVKIKAYFHDKGRNEPIISITCTSIFEILDIKKHKKGEKYFLSDPFLITVAGIGYTHTRAILSQHARGLYILPMVNPVEFFGPSIKKAIDEENAVK